MGKLITITPIILILICIILISCNEQVANEVNEDLEANIDIIFTPSTADTPADGVGDDELISMFKSIYENGSKINDWRNALSINIEYGTVYNKEYDNSYVLYYKVENITNIESVKANCELVFSYDLLTEVVYPILLYDDYPTFIEIEKQLYVVEQGTYMTGAGVDYTNAVVIDKNADSFTIEVPMISLYNPEGEIYTYKIIKQNGNWVLDNHFCFARDA